MAASHSPATQSRARSLALLGLAVGMVSIQAGASLAKQLFPLIGARGATGLRLSFAALILCAVVRPWRHRLTWHQRRVILAYGAVLGGMNLSFYLAIARIPLGVAVALEFTGPLAVALLASRRPRDVVWAALAIGGLMGIIPGGHTSLALDPIGVLFALTAGVCWALYIVFGQRAGAVVPGSVASALGMLTAAIVVLPLCVWQVHQMTFTAAVLPIAIAVAILSSALPYSLEMIALQRIPVKTFGILMSVEPAIGAILGLIFLHERLLIPQWTGIACVILASIGSTATAAHPTVTSDLPEIEGIGRTDEFRATP